MLSHAIKRLSFSTFAGKTSDVKMSRNNMKCINCCIWEILVLLMHKSESTAKSL